MERPLSGSDGTQAIPGEIDAFTDADAGVTDEQEGVTGDIVTAQEFLLDELILFGASRDGGSGHRAEARHRDGKGEPGRADHGAKPVPRSGGAER